MLDPRDKCFNFVQPVPVYYWEQSKMVQVLAFCYIWCPSSLEWNVEPRDNERLAALVFVSFDSLPGSNDSE